MTKTWDPVRNRWANKRPQDTAVAGLVAYESVSKAYTSAKDVWNKHFAFTVTVSEKDALYMDIHRWLLSIMPDEKHRSLLVTSESSNSDHTSPVSEEKADAIKPLTIRFNDQAPRKVVIDGHRVTVSLRTPDAAANQNSYREPEASKIEFRANSYSGQQAIIGHLERINSERATSRKAVLRMVGQYGSWKVRSDLPARTLVSVSIPEDQKMRIVNDLQRFLDEEEMYNRLAIPWHRSYMFEGPPGNGKTSIIKGLAYQFNLDLWYVSLSDLKTEASLIGLLAEVGPRSMLLLEDVDTMKLTNDDESSEQGTISIGSLLNTLDGVATPHGLITAMTTNHFDKLDPRLTRAGRMDMIEKIDHPSITTLANMFCHFYGRLPNWPAVDSVEPIPSISSAQVAEIFKRNMTDPDTSERTVKKLLFDNFGSVYA